MTCNHSILSRRRFLTKAAGAGAMLAAPWFVPGRALGKNGGVPASERITLGGIGVGNRGTYVLGFMLDVPGVQFLGACDVRANRREAVKKLVDGKYGNRDCTTCRDLCELLARSDIDAVLIATGDRWHAAATSLAAKAGKDIYCEKPCSMSIRQAAALADTVRRYGRIFQVGTQRRNVGNFQCAVDLARSGRLGKLQTVHASIYTLAENHNWLAIRTGPGVRRAEEAAPHGPHAGRRAPSPSRRRCPRLHEPSERNDPRRPGRRSVWQAAGADRARPVAAPTRSSSPWQVPPRSTHNHAPNL